MSKGYAQRVACRVAGLSRSSYCRRRALASQPSATDKHAGLREWLVKFAEKHHRWGYRRAWKCARAEGWDAGRETVRRLWRAENLRVAPRRKGKRLKTTISPQQQVKADHPGHVWALDFQFDSDWKGKAIKICNVVDEYTREHVTFAVDRALTAKDVIELLWIWLRWSEADPRCSGWIMGRNSSLMHWHGGLQKRTPSGRSSHLDSRGITGMWSLSTTACVTSCSKRTSSMGSTTLAWQCSAGHTGTITTIRILPWDSKAQHSSRLPNSNL